MYIFLDREKNIKLRRIKYLINDIWFYGKEFVNKKMVWMVLIFKIIYIVV